MGADALAVAMYCGAFSIVNSIVYMPWLNSLGVVIEDSQDTC